MTAPGIMRTRVTFSEPTRISDGYGNTTEGWTARGTVWAEVIHLKGGETVMAARLTGTHTQVFRIRRSALSRAVTTEWRADADGVAFNIRDVTRDPLGRFDELLCESGVAI